MQQVSLKLQQTSAHSRKRTKANETTNSTLQLYLQQYIQGDLTAMELAIKCQMWRMHENKLY